MAVSPCPIVDSVFMELADTLLSCSESRRRGCFECPSSEECHRRWNAISNRAAMRYLNEADKEWFMNWLDKLKQSVIIVT